MINTDEIVPGWVADGNYHIHWHSNLNGVRGRSVNSYSEEQAQALCNHLNEYYPHVIHTVRHNNGRHNDPVPVVDHTKLDVSP